MPFRRNYRKRAVRKSRMPRKKPMSKALAPSTAVAVRKIAKSVLNNVVETKIADYAYSPAPLASLFHNTWYQFESDPFTMYQGTSDDEGLNPINRLGDSIFVKGILFKIYLTTFATFPTNAYRIVILKCKGGLSSPADITAHPQSSNKLIMPVDREEESCRTVVYDKVLTQHTNQQLSLIAGSTSSDKHILWSHYLPINKKIKYEGNTGGSRGDVYRIFCLAYDTQATVGGITNIARFSYFRRTYFQDA